MTLNFDEASKLLAYDPDTGLLRWKVATNRRIKVGSVAGAVASGGYLQVRVHGKNYLGHRLAWLLHTGAWPSQQIDHISGQRDDNRIENLRECNPSQNQQNLGKRSNNTSGVTGVYLHKPAGKWMAYIAVNCKLLNLGLFPTIEEAAAARAAAKQLYHKFQPTDRN